MLGNTELLLFPVVKLTLLQDNYLHQQPPPSEGKASLRADGETHRCIHSTLGDNFGAAC